MPIPLNQSAAGPDFSLLSALFYSDLSRCDGGECSFKGTFHVKKHALYYVKPPSPCRPNPRRNVLMNITTPTVTLIMRRSSKALLN